MVRLLFETETPMTLGSVFGNRQTVAGYTVVQDEDLSLAQVTLREGPVVTLALSDDSLAEGDDDAGEEQATVTATVDPAHGQAFEVAVSTEPASSDRFEFVGANRTLSFAANATSSTGTVTLRAVANDVDDGDLEVAVNGAPDSSDVAAPAAATLTVVDDDLPTVSLAMPAAALGGYLFENEASATGAGAWTVTRAGLTDAALDVEVEVREATAQPVGDFVAPADTGTVTLTIPANETAVQFNPITADTTPEDPGVVTVLLLDKQADYDRTGLNRLDLRIRDDDGELVTVTFADTAVSGAEGSAADVELVLTADPDTVTFHPGTGDRKSDLERAFGAARYDMALDVATAEVSPREAASGTDYTALAAMPDVRFADFAAEDGGAVALRVAYAIDIADDGADPSDAGERFVVRAARRSTTPGGFGGTPTAPTGYTAVTPTGESVEEDLALAQVTIVEWPADGLTRLVHTGLADTGKRRTPVAIYEDGVCKAFDPSSRADPDEEAAACPEYLEGRVEVAVDGEFGTVCDDYWTDPDGEVACRALGLEFDRYYVRGRGGFNIPALGGEVKILLDDMHCAGDEASLLDCDHRGRHRTPVHNCRHSEDVAVRCTVPNYVPPKVPDKVTGVTAGPHGIGEIIVRWLAPVQAGELTYDIERAPNSNGRWTSLVKEFSAGKTETTYIDREVGSSGEQRWYRVRATNAEGTGETSEPCDDDEPCDEDEGQAPAGLRGADGPSAARAPTRIDGKASADAVRSEGAVLPAAQTKAAALDDRGRPLAATGGTESGLSGPWSDPVSATTPTVAVSSPSAVEGAALSFAVTLDREVAAAVVLDYASADGTATAGADYASVSGTLDFAAGETAKTVSVTTLADDTVEAAETLSLVVSESGAEHARGTGTIEDATPAPPVVPAVTVSDASAAEGGTLTFTVRIERAADGFAVRYATADGTATAGADYTAASGALTFGAGETAKTVSVTTLADATHEAVETLALVVSNESGTELARATGTIEEAAPAVTVSDAFGPEGEALEFTVRIERAAAGFAVRYATADGTATAGDDYTANSGALTFGAGETARTVSVATLADATHEAAETLALVVSNESGTELARATGTIEEAAPAVTVSDAFGPEGEALEFTVRIERAADGFAVRYATADGTATAGADYTAASGTLDFGAGETAKTVSVATLDDALDEGAETFRLAATDASGAELARGEGTIEDLKTVGVSVSDAAAEEGGTLAFAVTLDGVQDLAVSVDYATADGTATAGDDYTAASGTLTFAAGERSKTVAVAALDDAAEEAAETFALVLSNASRGARLDDAEGTGTIAASDGVRAWFDAVPAEHDGTTTFVLQLVFSEHVPGLRAMVVRNDLLTIGNGARKLTRRAAAGRNERWNVHVVPASTAAVTVTVNDGVGLPDGRTVRGGAQATVPGPAPVSAVADGGVVTLTWPSGRDGFGAPYASDYAVAVDGAPRAVASAVLAGRRVTLVLAAAVGPEAAVTVGYLGSAMHPLADATGALRSAPWFDLPAINATGTTEAPPTGAPAPPRPADPFAAAAAGAARLDASGYGLDDLARLGGLDALERLDASDNALADLGPLAGLVSLREVDLSGNRIVDVSALSGLYGLERLDLSGNRIADAGPLAGLPNLTVLLLDGNPLADAGPLLHLGTLENLGLADTRIRDVSALADLWSLRRLDLGGLPVGDLSPLGDVGTLVWLRLPGARLGADAALGRLTRLRWVWAAPPAARDAAAERAP